MELKHDHKDCDKTKTSVLIVPYGIETIKLFFHNESMFKC